jgi:hypothetical protein
MVLILILPDKLNLQPGFMIRFASTAFLVSTVCCLFGQPKQVSLGLFTGIAAPFTWDDGISNDSRYQARYEVKFAPIGLAYGVDYQGYGFVLTPSLLTIGQNFNIINTVGGYEGIRRINMQYLHVPIAFKLHMIDLSFFKVSLVAGIGAAYLINGKETVSHENAKYRFPAAVYPILPDTYTVEYDGVLAPKVKDITIVTKKDFNPFQISAGLGFRSDWDVTEAWRISFDVRANYCLLETRTDEYLEKVKSNQAMYDMAGSRKEIFAYLTIGISRYIEVDKEKEHKTKSFKKFTPKKSPVTFKPRRPR